MEIDQNVYLVIDVDVDSDVENLLSTLFLLLSLLGFALAFCFGTGSLATLSADAVDPILCAFALPEPGNWKEPLTRPRAPLDLAILHRLAISLHFLEGKVTLTSIVAPLARKHAVFDNM